MNFLVIGIALLLWGYVLGLLARAGLLAWRFLLGCGGIFLFFMLCLRPLATGICVQWVCALAGVIGEWTHTFSSYVQYGVLYIPAKGGALTLLVNFECSGAIEISGYLSLLAFYTVYDYLERGILGVAGAAYLLAADVLRLTLIAEIVRFFGIGAYYAAHIFVGRLLFYMCSILLYYYVFTQRQVTRVKIGNFSYHLVH